MTLLLLGATGLLGQAVARQAERRGRTVLGAARSGAHRELDVADADALRALVEEIEPDLVVNCAAVVDLGACERDPGRAYAVNARPAAILAEAGARVVHVSTDHFWTGDGDAPHDEDAPVRLLNEYARSKYAGEAFALVRDDALVIRTNIVGFRGAAGRPTFAEWAIGAIEAGDDLSLFDDFFTSSVDVSACATAMLDLADMGASGTVNVGSRQVASKREFVLALADALGRDVRHSTASVRGLQPPRAESLGLDVARAERLLDRRLPDLRETVEALVHQRPVVRA